MLVHINNSVFITVKIQDHGSKEIGIAFDTGIRACLLLILYWWKWMAFMLFVLYTLYIG